MVGQTPLVKKRITLQGIIHTQNKDISLRGQFQSPETLQKTESSFYVILGGSYRHFAKVCLHMYEGQFHQENVQECEMEGVICASKYCRDDIEVGATRKASRT